MRKIIHSPLYDHGPGLIFGKCPSRRKKPSQFGDVMGEMGLGRAKRPQVTKRISDCDAHGSERRDDAHDAVNEDEEPHLWQGRDGDGGGWQ